jgi:ABC-type dipeptide/oligopeptide/nickel transport system permease component
MLTFVVRRLLLAVPVLLGVVFVVMLTVDLLPGDAVTLMLGEHATNKGDTAHGQEHQHGVEGESWAKRSAELINLPAMVRSLCGFARGPRTSL